MESDAHVRLSFGGFPWSCLKSSFKYPRVHRFSGSITDGVPREKVLSRDRVPAAFIHRLLDRLGEDSDVSQNSTDRGNGMESNFSPSDGWGMHASLPLVQ